MLVLQTGIGQARTETALKWLLGHPVLGSVPYRPQLVLSAGFAGALQESLRVGDVVLATEVRNTEGKCWPVLWPQELPDREWQRSFHHGRLLSVPGLVTSPEEKRRLGGIHQAVAVDMESATVAGVCEQRQVPFGCVRVISDDVHTPLSPRLVALLSGGRVSPLRILSALLCSPGLVGQFMGLAKRTNFAATQLGKVLGELLTRALSQGAD